ncbi:DUF2169 domain-containing protein [Halomonas sp. BDJS001]|uniref:DUF2169 domain-containing protein n=1 Tax=Halomonas sp. BDJS001 TaxID=2992143 RepID=UPI0039BD4721
MPLDYRYAFGGHYRLPEGDALANTLYYPDNPAGRGWLPSARTTSGYPARSLGT